MRKTKIICTLGPATESADILAQMIAAGANIFRLNMSHATHEWIRAIVPRIRNVARDMGGIVGIDTRPYGRDVLPDGVRWLFSHGLLAPIDLETVSHKCLHKDPEQRYATALELTRQRYSPLP